MQTCLKFEDFLHPRPQPKGIDVSCKLKHFSIITYAVDPVRFSSLIPPRFKLDTVTIDNEEKALVSVVPFIDVDFALTLCPLPKFTMGQTNYRIYIIDTETSEHGVWFLGTTLDSWTLVVPRHVWNLPWYSGKVTSDCTFDATKGIYTKYNMKTLAAWAPATVSLIQDASDEMTLEGFPDQETSLVYLTHSLAGFYHRRDNKLGAYHVWHKKLDVKPAKLTYANFGLLSRLGLVTEREQQYAHSVLIERINEFTIYLPPEII